MSKRLCLTCVVLLAWGADAWADPHLSVAAAHDGFREYYCVTRGTLTNTGDAEIREVNGFFRIFRDGEQIGHSRGTSFLDLAPGASAEGLFEAPHVECDTADAYEFVVSACMQGTSFMNRSDCAALISGEGKVTAISAR